MEPELFDEIRVTVYWSAFVYTCVGFLAVLVAPSPKSHDQEVGPPGDVSANITVCPTVGEAGLKTKVAVAGAGMMVSVRIVLLEPEWFVTIRFTLWNPGFINVCTGFFSVLVEPSPKSQSQDVGSAVDVPSKLTACPSTGKAGEYVKDTLKLFALLDNTLARKLLCLTWLCVVRGSNWTNNTIARRANTALSKRLQGILLFLLIIPSLHSYALVFRSSDEDFVTREYGRKSSIGGILKRELCGIMASQLIRKMISIRKNR